MQFNKTVHKSFAVFALALLTSCSHGESRSPSGQTSQPKNLEATSYPILHELEKKGATLYPDTTTWMAKWLGMDLEQTDVYSFPKITGSTSVNLKIQKNAEAPAKPEALGIFLAPNDSGNPTTELAYFNLSAVLGWDKIFRPAARYELGPKAQAAFLAAMAPPPATAPSGTPNPITSDQQSNADNIRKLIASGNPLQGCLKADKDKTGNFDDDMADGNYDGTACPEYNGAKDPNSNGNGGPNFKNPVVASLQVTNPAPVAGTQVTLIQGYTGDALELAIEYSVVMSFDVIFQQGDRYSGGNIGIRNDANGQAHMYSTDNGGAYLDNDPTSAKMNLAWFSRYDRKTIDGLRKINNFLLHPETGYLGYKDAVSFVTDLGLYFEMDPATSTTLLQRNIQMLLDKVDATFAKYGNTTYLN